MTMLTATELLAWLQANWGWAAGLAASMMGLTALAGLLNRARKDEVALWLMGAQTEEGWARSFTTLFDAVFGRRHLSLRCFLRSALASLIAVVVIWLLMGSAEAIGLRLQADLTLGSVLVLGLAINVVADYLSLLETRLLLAHMPRHWLAQAAILLLDLLLSAAIIWLAIFAFLRSPLHQGETESFAEILGVFSIFSVFFYSTFLTSVWTWAYIASTWLMRLLRRVRLAEWLDVEDRPILILSNVLALVTFLGALAFSGTLTRDDQGLTAADRNLCSIFRGRVCLDVASLTPVEQSQLEFVTLACARFRSEECLDQAGLLLELEPASIAGLMRASCGGGDGMACAAVATFLSKGIGLAADPEQSFHFSQRGCELGDDWACTNLATDYLYGQGVDKNPQEAARLYQRSCGAGHPNACTGTGLLHLNGVELPRDRVEAARFFQIGCEGGHALGCTNLGYLFEQGEGVEQDLPRAANLYQRGCDGGEEVACTNLGLFYERGAGVEADLAEAARLFRLGCDREDSVGCTRLGRLFQHGLGVQQDDTAAVRLFDQGCELGHSDACRRAVEMRGD